MNVLKVYRGDIFYIRKVDPITGSEQDQGRPAVIVSNDIGNEHANIVEVVYLTTKDKKPMPTHVEVKSNVLSTALCEQITTVSKERLGDFIRQCTYEEMQAIDRALLVSLGIDHEAPGIACGEPVSLEYLQQELKKNQLVTIPEDNELIQVTTERDLYKRLYEQLLEKVIQ